MISAALPPEEAPTDRRSVLPRPANARSPRAHCTLRHRRATANTGAARLFAPRTAPAPDAAARSACRPRVVACAGLVAHDGGPRFLRVSADASRFGPTRRAPRLVPPAHVVSGRQADRSHSHSLAHTNAHHRQDTPHDRARPFRPLRPHRRSDLDTPRPHPRHRHRDRHLMPAGVHPHCDICGSTLNSWVVRVCHRCETQTAVTVNSVTDAPPEEIPCRRSSPSSQSD